MELLKFVQNDKTQNKKMHLTFIPLRSIKAGDFDVKAVKVAQRKVDNLVLLHPNGHRFKVEKPDI